MMAGRKGAEPIHLCIKSITTLPEGEIYDRIDDDTMSMVPVLVR